MERERAASVATFYAPGAWSDVVALSADASHHARVRRLSVGDTVRLTSGDGRRVSGAIETLGKGAATVSLDVAAIEHVEAPPAVELCAPIGDRERMLMLAEKAVELGASAWSPVLFARSRSVSPRGEGEAFRAKVVARQVGALEQSGSAWLPVLHDEQAFASLAAPDARGGSRILLDAAGESLGHIVCELEHPIRIALGPEGGLEEAERDALISHGWRPASLGANILRFETAAISALAIVRTHGR